MSKITPTGIEEQKLWDRGYLACGIDEAGMGPLAGPVVAAAVILSRPPLSTEDYFKKWEDFGVCDSKLLSEKKRIMIYHQLVKENDCQWGIGIIDEKTIDAINILQAGLMAMQRAVQDLLQKYHTSHDPSHIYLCVDGRNIIPDLSLNQKAIINGDAKLFSIACASIIAKCTRDAIMYTQAKKYPQYQFEKHKGYGTKLHFSLITQHGLSPIHRKSFLKKYGTR